MEESYEARYARELKEKVLHGNITDAEIQDVIDIGGDVLRTMERRAEHLHKEKKMLNRDYGDGAFDGIDNNGNLYKDISLEQFLRGDAE